MDLLKSMMAPKASRGPVGPGWSGKFIPPAYGSVSATVAAVTALTKAAVRLAPEVRKAIQSDEALSKREIARYIQLKSRLERATDPEDILRLRTSMISARERGEIYKLKSMVAGAGRVPLGPRLEGTAIEIRRNALAEQWENAPAEEKRQIEALISGYDQQLITLEHAVRATLDEELRQQEMASQPGAPAASGGRRPGLFAKMKQRRSERRADRAARDQSVMGADDDDDEGEPAESAEPASVAPTPAATPAAPAAPAPATPAAPAGPPAPTLRDPELILPMYDEGIRQLVRGLDDTEISLLDAEIQNAKSGYGPRGATTEEQDALYAEQTFKAAVLNPEQPVSVNQALVTGLGGLQFASDGPPGPGRNVRIAMYPGRASDSYAGADGIVVPGDDPVLLMRLTATVNTNFVASTDYIVRTQTFTYGAYRAMGFQCNPQGNYLVSTATGENRNTSVVVGVGISVRSLQIYNGEEMLLPVGEIDASTMSILDPPDGYFGISALNLPAYLQAGPYNPRAADRYYMGLRTNPVLDSTGRVDAVVRCFAYVKTSNPAIAPTGMLATDRIEVPISFNLIGQMLEDKIFGNPKVPGPAARPGAQVQLGLRDLGRDTEGVQQLQLRNTRYVPLIPEPTS